MRNIVQTLSNMIVLPISAEGAGRYVFAGIGGTYKTLPAMNEKGCLK